RTRKLSIPKSQYSSSESAACWPVPTCLLDLPCGPISSVIPNHSAHRAHPVLGRGAAGDPRRRRSSRRVRGALQPRRILGDAGLLVRTGELEIPVGLLPSRHHRPEPRALDLRLVHRRVPCVAEPRVPPGLGARPRPSAACAAAGPGGGHTITWTSFRPNHATSAVASSSRSFADHACRPSSPRLI